MLATGTVRPGFSTTGPTGVQFLVEPDQGRRSIEGVVLEVMLPNTSDAHAWAASNGGVLIEGGGLGLSVTESLENDDDVVFVRRASSKP